MKRFLSLYALLLTFLLRCLQFSFFSAVISASGAYLIINYGFCEIFRFSLGIMLVCYMIVEFIKMIIKIFKS